MQILQWGILIGLVLVVPYILGMIPVSHMKQLQKTPAMAYACGWFVSFSIFELIAIPFILLEWSFTALVWIFTLITAALMVLSLWKGRKTLTELSRKSIEAFRDSKGIVRCGWAVVFILIGLQLLAAVFLEYYDGDDAYYIATAVMTGTFDTMYLRDNYTGYIYPLDIRHALSPTPIYQAWLSRLSGIHPAIIAHSVLSVVWLVFMYCIYGQLANRLFPKKKEYRPLFMIFIIIWFSFGNISIYTAETFAMTRTWQGKGLMAGVVVPALFLCLLYLMDKKPKAGTWILLETVLVSAVFATSTAFMLVPTVMGVAAVLLGIYKRSWKIFLQMCVSCVPCLALGLCYLLAR